MTGLIRFRFGADIDSIQLTDAVAVGVGKSVAQLVHCRRLAILAGGSFPCCRCRHGSFSVLLRPPPFRCDVAPIVKCAEQIEEVDRLARQEDVYRSRIVACSEEHLDVVDANNAELNLEHNNKKVHESSMLLFRR